MAQLDSVVRVYHATNPTGEQLLCLKAPCWPNAYTLAASFPDPGLPPEQTLHMAFERTQQDHPLINTVRWNPGARRRSTSPGDVVVLTLQRHLSVSIKFDHVESRYCLHQ